MQQRILKAILSDVAKFYEGDIDGVVFMIGMSTGYVYEAAINLVDLSGSAMDPGEGDNYFVVLDPTGDYPPVYTHADHIMFVQPLHKPKPKL